MTLTATEAADGRPRQPPSSADRGRSSCVVALGLAVVGYLGGRPGRLRPVVGRRRVTVAAASRRTRRRPSRSPTSIRRRTRCPVRGRDDPESRPRDRARAPGMSRAETFASGPAVVLVHGLDSCKREGQLLLAAGMLHRAGICGPPHRSAQPRRLDRRERPVCRRDPRVPRRPRRLGLARRASAASRRNGSGIYGQSLGAGHGPDRDRRRAAGRRGLGGQQLRRSRRRRSRPSCDGTATRPWLRFGRLPHRPRLRSGDDLLSLSPIGAVAKLDGRPIFITHGTGDTRLSVQYASDLAAAVRADGGDRRTVDRRGRRAHPGDRPGNGRVRAATGRVLHGSVRGSALTFT